jgi:hypothetical protein
MKEGVNGQVGCRESSRQLTILQTQQIDLLLRSMHACQEAALHSLQVLHASPISSVGVSYLAAPRACKEVTCAQPAAQKENIVSYEG